MVCFLSGIEISAVMTNMRINTATGVCMGHKEQSMVYL